MDIWTDVERQYRRFAREADDSPTYADWASHVADDADVTRWLESLPQPKQQPNLVFAAARIHGVAAPGPYTALRDTLLCDDEAGGPVRRTIMARSTQTNEAGRLATLTPLLARIAAEHDGSALSLLEVGASAGLCLYPDSYRYRWTTDDGEVSAGEGPTLTCRVSGTGTLPTSVPDVAARRGVDLHPLDVERAEDVAWLEALVWPEHDDRRARLHHAIGIARADPPVVSRGDLLAELPRLVAEAAADGPVVVFHSAVIAYLPDEERVRFDELVRGLVADGACHWISNEAPAVLASVTATGPPVPEQHPTFVLGLDGRAVAWTHGHGRTLRWLPR